MSLSKAQRKRRDFTFFSTAISQYLEYVQSSLFVKNKNEFFYILENWNEKRRSIKREMMKSNPKKGKCPPIDWRLQAGTSERKIARQRKAPSRVPIIAYQTLRKESPINQKWREDNV